MARGTEPVGCHGRRAVAVRAESETCCTAYSPWLAALAAAQPEDEVSGKMFLSFTFKLVAVKTVSWSDDD